MSQTRTHPKSARLRQVAQIGVLALLTAAAWMWARYSRQFLGHGALSLNDLTRLDFNAYAVGISIQALIPPLVLVYILSNTSLFRQVVAGKAGARDLLKLSALLIVMQVLALIYDLWLFSRTFDRTTFGVLIVIVGGLLGGWRLGLGLGLITLAICGAYLQVLETRGSTFLLALRLMAPEDLPAWALLQEVAARLWHEFLFFYLANLRVSMAVWGGLVAGVCMGLLKERWTVPAVAFGLGAAIEFGAGFFTALTVPAPGEFISLLLGGTLVTGMGLAAVALIVRAVQADAARRKAERTELALARAELRALRAQIKPHFLFNALNTIRYFVRTDPEAARQLLLNLSEVFQRAIRSGEVVPLRDELVCIQAYLSLEKARLGERLKVIWAGEVTRSTAWDQDESPILDSPIPTLSLQPIVENAVVHGIAKKPEGGTVRIGIERTGRDLSIQVEDDGIGMEPTRLAKILKPTNEQDTSIGLRNVDGRLRALYGEDYGLVVESTLGRGTRVKIKVPVGRIPDGR